MPLKHSKTQQRCCHWRSRLLRGTLWVLAACCSVGLTNFCLARPVQLVQEQEPESDLQETTVADVRIEGNDTIPESVILQKIQTQPNRALTERQIREDKRSLMGTRWFFSVSERIEETPQGRVLIFKVHERPIVQRVAFIGNKKVKTKYLEAWTGLKAGSPFDHVANREAVHRIEQEYKEKGHFFVKVTLEKGGNPGEREVVFRIDEGPKVRVQHRTFEGNSFWGNGDLKKNLASKEALLGELPWFDGFGGFYRPETLNQDVESLKQFYRSVGFFDIELTGEPRFSPDRASVDLHFTVSEGVRYKVRDIRFQGNQIVSTQQLESDSKLLPGQHFNAHPLGKDVQRMLKYYGDMGHYFASVNPVPQFTETPGIVDLVFEVDEDRPRYIRNVEVGYDGDYPHTKQTVVLDRLQLGPGDLANPAMIRRSRSRLNGSGLFEPGIQFDVTPVDPENMSFASNTRTFRGQNSGAPAGSQESWTDRFANYTQWSAEMSVIGSNPWQKEVTGQSAQPSQQPTTIDDQKSDQTGSTDSSMSALAPSSRSHTLNDRGHLQPTAARSSIPVSSHASIPSNPGGHSGLLASSGSRTGGSIALAGYSTGYQSVSGASHLRGNPDNTANVLSHLSDQTVVASDDHRQRPGIAGSEVVGFRAAEPHNLFDIDASEFLAPTQTDPDAPIIRAQSPSDPIYGAQPRPTDPVLEGSPYRNQFQSIPPGWVDLNVRAAEGRTGRLMAGAGVNSDAGLVGSFVWDESNFDLFRPPQTFADVIEGRAWRGGGQRFRLEAAPGNNVSRYAISWVDPYFLYSDYSLSLSGFYFNRFYPDWSEDRVGGRIGVGRQLTPEWSVNAALRLEEVEMKNPRTPTPPVAQKDLGTNFLSTVRLSATHDTRDMSIMPGEGHFLDVGWEQAFNEYTYPRIEGEFRQYFTVRSRPDGSGRHVITLAGNLGWSGDDTPVFERYFAGGFQSFRGFSFRGVSPRTDGFATGGTFQMLGTLEYRLPVTADDMINVVAFTDFGTVEEEVSLDHFRATAGFGLRVVVPAMGPVPLAFDFAFPIASEVFDDERIFSFYVGINR